MYSDWKKFELDKIKLCNFFFRDCFCMFFFFVVCYLIEGIYGFLFIYNVIKYRILGLI